MSTEPDALRLAKGLRTNTLLISDRDEAAEVLETLHAEVKDWSDRACNLQHALNVALRERDQARFDLQAARKSLQDHAELAVADAGLLREAMAAVKSYMDAVRIAPNKAALMTAIRAADDQALATLAALRKRLGE